ncbi:MAG: histidinol-phosphatase [Gammaproteobacteria bacterium]|nr:MAG: histidinol-phosphatase [Gammaproteobacteria bacterium]
MKKINILLLFLFSIDIFSVGEVFVINDYKDMDRIINFPNTEKYKVIVADLHTHSVFSDGAVWPNVRVEEAVRDGIDLLAITEHLEYQPHIDDIPHPDRNRSFDIAEDIAKNKDLTVINGAEITRMFPPGHINAIFIEDANKLIYLDETKISEAKEILKEVPEESLTNYEDLSWLEDAALASLWPVKSALIEARNQNAFTFWNHPAWSSEEFIGQPMLREIHKEFFRDNLLHGIEVANGDGYSEEAFRIALEYGLTVLGTSDVHGLIDWDYPSSIGAHRPVTLILSESNSIDAIKSSLFSGKTVVWFKNNLIGLEDNILELTNSYLKAKKVEILENSDIARVEIENVSDVRFIIQVLDQSSIVNESNLIEIAPNEKTVLQIDNGIDKGSLDVKILNAFIAPNKNLLTTLKF